MNILSQLKKIGFSDKSAHIYITLLDLGEATVIEIAKQAKLKRTTVYNILPELIQSGFVKTAVKKRKRIFFIDDVRTLKEPLLEQQQILEQLVPQLIARQTVLPFKPRILFYEGERGVKDFFQDTLNSVPRGGEILEMVGPKSFYERLPSTVAQRYVPERVKRKIRIRIIASPSAIAKEMQKEEKKYLRTLRMIDGWTFQAAMVIYAQKVGFISFADAENFMGVTIESKTISELQRASFELMWQSLESDKR